MSFSSQVTLLAESQPGYGLTSKFSFFMTTITYITYQTGNLFQLDEYRY